MTAVHYLPPPACWANAAAMQVCPFHPDQTILHMPTGKLGEVQIVIETVGKIVALLDDGSRPILPMHEIRPVPVKPAFGVIVGGRA